MEVHFYGRYREIVGKKIVEYAAGRECSLLDLLMAVAEQFPALREEILDERGCLYPYIPLFLNGRNPRLFAEGLRAAVRSEDVLSIFTPIASGRINVEDVNDLLPG